MRAMPTNALVAVVLALAFACNVTTSPAARAADAPQTMLVIDGSGSMWGRFEADKRAKIDVIRELLAAKIESASAQHIAQQIGLTSFGHRRKGDCSDVEVIAEPGPDATAVLEPLAKLSPRGKGPLVAALREAAANLGKSRPASIIVIGDGTDNCQLDPCAAAAEIAAQLPGMPVHMISIGVEPADLPRLSCVAKTTGGTFYDVKDSLGLSAAIDAATKLAMLTPDTKSPSAPSAAAPAPPPTPTTAALQASVSLAAGGTAIAIPMHWRILKSGSSDVLAESDGSTIAATLEPGSYDVEADIGRIHVKQTVVIEAGHTAGIIVPLNAARLSVTTKGEKGAAPIIAIEPVNDGKPQHDAAILLRQATATQIIAAGNYAVSVSEGTARQTKSVSLAAGADTALEFAFANGRVELSAGLREDGGAIEDVTFTISEDDPDSADGRREVARSRSPTPSFTLPAGTYYASARAGDGEVRQRIAVGAGDVVKRALILPLVPVKVSALIGGQPAAATQGIVYRVTALDGERREVARSVLPEMTLNLLPGRYRIAAHLDAHHLKIAEEVTVETGKSLSVVLKFNAGEISLKPGAGVIATAGDTYWEILDTAGKPVWHSMAAEAKAFLAPGRYTVHLDVRDKRTEAAFEVRSGERMVVQVGQN